MASTLAGRRLTEAHRLGQIRIGARTVQQILASWHILDPTNLDGTLERWLRVALSIISAQRHASASLSAGYLAAFRAAEGADGDFLPVLAGAFTRRGAATALTVTGPVAVKIASGRGELLDAAVEIGKTLSAGAAMRWALDGGRDTIFASVAADDQALGYARATSGAPCYFCAMLAGRGAVYKSEETASFEAHDHCSCEPEPIYNDNADLPAGADKYGALWDRAGSVDEFRRLYEEG